MGYSWFIEVRGSVLIEKNIEGADDHLSDPPLLALFLLCDHTPHLVATMWQVFSALPHLLHKSTDSQRAVSEADRLILGH